MTHWARINCTAIGGYEDAGCRTTANDADLRLGAALKAAYLVAVERGRRREALKTPHMEYEAQEQNQDAREDGVNGEQQESLQYGSGAESKANEVASSLGWRTYFKFLRVRPNMAERCSRQ